MYLIIIFILLSVANVIGSTIRSLLTINGNKYVAALVNAVYFAFYTVVLVYTVADFPLWIKCLITFVCNLVGVFVVKLLDEKKKPIRMWKIEMALEISEKSYSVDTYLYMIRKRDIPCNCQDIDGWLIFNCYCDNKEKTKFLLELCKLWNGKISAYENKL